MARQTSPFLRLPTEIRLMIYEELLLPPASKEPCPPNTKFVAPDYHEYEPSSTSNTLRAPRTLQIRTIDPAKLAANPSLLPLTSSRPRYHIRSDAFRSRTTPTTYALQNNPGLHPAILGTCRQVHAEAAGLLYSSYAFDFDTHVEAIVPFLSALTPAARARIARLALVKRALPYVKEFDRAEWRAACEYTAAHLNVAGLSLALGVVAGKPPAGWADSPALTVEHFRLVQPRSVGSRPASGAATPTSPSSSSSGDDEGKVLNGEMLYGLGLKAIAGVDFEWVEQLLWLRGVRDVHVRAIVEHCPPPVSETMAFWVSFSKSVEGSFREWMRGVMLV